MGRIRTIKPEFPQSEKIGNLSRDARLLFIQIWTLVDDYGRARASSRMLASLLYPYDDDAKDLIGGWLDELEDNGHIRRYEVDETAYLDIPNWLKHQKIDHPSKRGLPENPEDSREIEESSRALAPDLGPCTLDLVPSTVDLSAARTAGKEEFETLKRVYPRRKGNAGWKAAERKFLSLVKTGVDPKIIIDAAKGFAATAGPSVGTQFIPLLASWLNSEDFVECAVAAFDDACPADIYENVL